MSTKEGQIPKNKAPLGLIRVDDKTAPYKQLAIITAQFKKNGINSNPDVEWELDLQTSNGGGKNLSKYLDGELKKLYPGLKVASADYWDFDNTINISLGDPKIVPEKIIIPLTVPLKNFAYKIGENQWVNINPKTREYGINEDICEDNRNNNYPFEEGTRAHKVGKILTELGYTHNSKLAPDV